MQKSTNNKNNRNKVNKKTFNRYKKRQNRRDRNQNRRINNLGKVIRAKFKNLGNNLMNFVVPYQKEYTVQNYWSRLNNYINGMLYPERYMNIGLRLPNPIGSYSFCYSFKEQFDFRPNQEGGFTLIWYPNFFSCATQNVGNIPIEGATKVTIAGNPSYAYGTKRFIYNNDLNAPQSWNFPTNHIYYSICEGYRLVSASIFISYIGNNINKAGYVMSIPTYRNIPAFALQGTEAPSIDGKFTTNLIPEFDSQVFVNTKGTHSTFTLSKRSVMKRIYVPIDPSDQVFEDPGYFYSSSVSSQQAPVSYESWEAAKQSGNFIDRENAGHIRILKPEDGNPLKYVFKGVGFVNTEELENNTIHVEAYYNFECIPAEGMRVPTSGIEEQHEEVKDSDKNVVIKKISEMVGKGISINKNSVQKLKNEIKEAVSIGAKVATTINNANKILGNAKNGDLRSLGFKKISSNLFGRWVPEAEIITA